MRKISKLFCLNFLYILLIAAQIVAIVFLCLYIPSLLVPAAAACAVHALDFAAAVVILVSESPADVKCAKFALIVFLPAAGAIICLAFRKKRAPAPAPMLAGYTYARYFATGKEYLEAVFERLESAKANIYIELFIIARGKLFEKFTKILCAAAARGVDVRLSYDGVGSAFKIRPKDLKPLKKAGVKIKVFHRLSPFPLPKLNVRDHRKIICVDGEHAFTGGANLADEYANLRSPFGYWKDTGAEVRGQAAKAFERIFLSVWGGPPPPPDGADGKEKCLVFCDGGKHPAFICDEYARAICRAEQKVHVFTPYFCPTEGIMRALCDAAARGVDVKIIIPHIPDKKYAFYLSKACAAHARGVQFYEYTPGFMHAKSLICDGEAYIGSYNLDYRSLGNNLECGVKFCGGIADEAERDFMRSLALSKRCEYPASGFKKFLARVFSPLF